MMTLAFLASGTLAAASPCPDRSMGETAQDCPWAEVTRELISAAQRNEALTPIFEKKLPRLYQQILADSKKPALKEAWGQSMNFDEFARQTIVDPRILKMLAELFSAPAPESNRAHAGLEHVYGYLFSVLKTPFGYKRARWVRGEIERGFGLAADTLSPLAPEGTLLGNVTYFMGKIAFRTEPSQLSSLEAESANVPKSLRLFQFGKLKLTRIEEKTEAATLRTDLIPFSTPPQDKTADSYLLVYSVSFPDTGKAKLITAFPVTASAAERILQPSKPGAPQLITPRYNAYVEGLSGAPAKGSRRVVKETYVP